MSSVAHFSQTASNRGSSTGTRPRESLTESPRSLKIFKPRAPFFTSFSSCAAARSAQPGASIPA